MGVNKLLPDSYEALATELGGRVNAFDALFQEAIRYFDALLGQDARSTPALEKSYLDRFSTLLADEGFLPPKNIREALIKLSYGFYMKTRT